MKNLLSTLPNSSQGFFLSNTEIVHNVAVIHIKLGRFCACRRGKCSPNVGKIERGKPRCQDRAGPRTTRLARRPEPGRELGRDIVSSSGARLAGCVCGGGGVFGGAVVDIRRRATMNNASKEAGRCSAREWGWGCPGKQRAKRTGNLDCKFSSGSSQRLRE